MDRNLWTQQLTKIEAILDEAGGLMSALEIKRDDAIATDQGLIDNPIFIFRVHLKLLMWTRDHLRQQLELN